MLPSHFLFVSRLEGATLGIHNYVIENDVRGVFPKMDDSSSQSSSLAPIDFNLSSSLEESNGAISVAVEKCQLCGGSRRPFYCKNCVKKGEFTYSTRPRSDR